MGDDMFIIAYEQTVIMHDQRHIHVIMNIIVNPIPMKVFFWDLSEVHKVAKMEVQKRVPFSEICQKLNLFKLNPRSSIFFC